MLAALLLLVPQDALLPPRPDPAAPDARLRALLEQQSSATAWSWEEIQALRPANPAEAAALADWLAGTDAARLRLGAVLGAGSESLPAWELYAIGTRTQDEAVGVACLLAPATPPPAWWPALARVAVRSSAPLALRAAAVARLLEAGCWDAWPIARSMLRTGTAEDEAAPWADWQRSGRYELPKRLLVGALDQICARQGAPACGIEPNAAWTAQVQTIAAFEATAQRLRAATPLPLVTPEWSLLLEQARAGDGGAREAVLLLGRGFDAALQADLATGDLQRAEFARALLRERPR